MGIEERSERLKDPILRGYWVPDLVDHFGCLAHQSQNPRPLVSYQKWMVSIYRLHSCEVLRGIRLRERNRKRFQVIECELMNGRLWLVQE
jgi:hypothetical protein